MYIVNSLVLAFSGLSLFIYGISTTSSSLQTLANNKLRVILSKATDKTYKALLLGAGLSSLIQSSSAITALTLAFISAGYISFKQGLTIVMGTNVGTTTTSLLIGLNIKLLAPLLIIIGVVIFSIYNKERTRARLFASCFFGVGLLFWGLNIMSTNLVSLLLSPNIYPHVTTLSRNPLLGFVTGIFITAVVQSSSASIGIIQSLFANNVISLSSSIGFMLGANVGTTFTGMIASVSGTKSAKKVALINMLFNLFGGILFMIFINQYSSLIFICSSWLSFNNSLMIAFSHVVFNIVCTILYLLFLKWILKLFNQEKKIEILALS